MSWEARAPDGTDDSPGRWDHERTLTDPDVLPAGGDFGLLALGFSYATGPFSPAPDILIVDLKLTCKVP
jgi:hypothetical protein